MNHTPFEAEYHVCSNKLGKGNEDNYVVLDAVEEGEFCRAL